MLSVTLAGLIFGVCSGTQVTNLDFCADLVNLEAVYASGDMLLLFYRCCLLCYDFSITDCKQLTSIDGLAPCVKLTELYLDSTS